ncbi:MAG: YbhB/YbcL family Raf kinase inhibitor-like protein [Patescibacteria group bacterium]
MRINSSVFVDGAHIPVKYTCMGEGINPPLDWSQVPVNTKSLVLIVDDPDAPSGVFSHWLVWNIPIHISELTENSVPVESVVGVGSSGENKYVAPCPPSGTHHYRFKLFALDIELFLSVNSRQVHLEQAMGGHILDQAMLIGLFEK